MLFVEFIGKHDYSMHYVFICINKYFKSSLGLILLTIRFNVLLNTICLVHQDCIVYFPKQGKSFSYVLIKETPAFII